MCLSDGVSSGGFDSVSEARSSLGRYLHFYNSRRPHSSLDDAAQDQAYFSSPPLRMAAQLLAEASPIDAEIPFRQPGLALTTEPPYAQCERMLSRDWSTLLTYSIRSASLYTPASQSPATMVGGRRTSALSCKSQFRNSLPRAILARARAWRHQWHSDDRGQGGR